MSRTSVKPEEKARASKTSLTFSNADSQTQEEGEEGGEEEEVPLSDEVEIRSTFFDKKYAKTTLAQIHREELKQKPLFAEVLVLDDVDMTVEQQSIDKTDMLVTGFGIRNLKSLQDALRQEEQRRLRELYKYRTSSGEEEAGGSSTSSKRLVSLESRTTETETERSSITSDISSQKLQLQYLMGLQTEAEEEHVEEEKPVEEAEEEYPYSTSKSMRSAQKYLRVNRIFDFFQLIIAHLLGAMPENPVNFILVYLNKCLLYRSGLGRPPILYEQKHIEQLYILMDRMNTGFIELEQYHRGMNTLAICEYEKSPPVTQDQMVAREFFIREALECEIMIFDDLIRKRWIGKKPPAKPISRLPSITQSTGPYFIPSDLLLKLRQYEISDIITIPDEGEG